MVSFLSTVPWSEPRSITFFADGSSTGGALKLTERERTLTVEIDPASGLVAPAPG